MAAPIVELCQAIADHIAAQTYSFTFEVKRVNWFESDLATTAKTNVYVYPGQPLASATQIYDRSRFTRRYTISVHVVNFIDDIDRDRETDDALLLVHELEQSLENVNFGEMQMMQFESENAGREFFGIEQAQERNTFHTIINIEYEGVV